MTSARSDSLRLMPPAPVRGMEGSGSRSHPTFAAYSPTLVEATLERVLASSAFRRSQRHRQFLRHVIRAALANEQEQLKEVIIGLEVFGRALSTYDPRRDPIVRVEAGRLREKLERFYADEGASEAFEITIPVGSYMPQFNRRRAVPDLRRSIAILPFNNLTNLPHDGAFAIGLADQLIDTLGQVKGMKVVARVSALKASEKELSLRALSTLLGVDHIVEGSIQRSGTRLRCIARLSRAKGGVQIWSRRFEQADSATDDLFALQDEIADAVLAAVTASLIEGGGPSGAATSTASTPQRAPLTHSNEARALFERARYLALQGSIDGYTRAIALLEKAVTLDPDFAQAHSQLGATRANLGPYVFAPTIATFAKVKESLLRALELNPLDGDAHALLAVIAHRIESGWETAEPLFIEALRMSPSSTLAHSSYAWALVFHGRYDEAIAHAKTAMELDPLNLAQRAYNARLYSYAGDYETALAELQIVLELDPDHLYGRLVLGIIHLSMGYPDQALPHFERVAEAVPDHSSAHLHIVCVHGMRGEVERGRRELEALLARWKAMPADRAPNYSPVYLALAAACLGDRDAMLHHLEQAASDRDYLFITTPSHVLFDRYRDDPAFIDLLHRHGLKLLRR